MKVTRLGPPQPIMNSGLGLNAGTRIPTGGTGLQVLTSDGSNGRYWGENVRRITSNGSNILLSPDVNIAAGSNVIFAIASNTLFIHGQAGGGGNILTANGSNSLASVVDLQAGVGIALGVSGQTITITNTGVPGPAGGGGGSSTIQYPALKPGTPTYDFDTASLPGAFSAHSSQGSFATTDCLTQGLDWGGSSLELQFSSQMGAVYVSHGNTDLDFEVGGMAVHGFSTLNAAMFGIAALDSSGNGVASLVYNDNAAYSAAITGWQYASNNDSWSGFGWNIIQAGSHWWLRLKRVSGTWTAYASVSGRTWDKTYSTRADSVTVDRLVFGMLYNTGVGSYSGLLSIDYFHVSV